MQVMTAQGAMMVQVPTDKKPGDMFTFMVPDAPVAPVAQPVATLVAAPQPVAGQPVGAPTVIVQPVAPVMAPVPHNSGPTFFGRHPVNATCPHCNHNGVTNTNYEVGLGTWAICCGIALVGCYSCTRAAASSHCAPHAPRPSPLARITDLVDLTACLHCPAAAWMTPRTSSTTAPAAAASSANASSSRRGASLKWQRVVWGCLL